jgi:hypothetical protein
MGHEISKNVKYYYQSTHYSNVKIMFQLFSVNHHVTEYKTVFSLQLAEVCQ